MNTMGEALKLPEKTPAQGTAREPTDASLIRRTLEGDTGAFEGIVRRYQDRAYWAAMHLLGDPEESRDVSQEAFLRAYRALSRFDFAMNFYTWLYRIVVNLSIDQLRKRSRLRPISLEDAPAGAAVQDDRHPPGSSLETREEATRVREVLDRLPEKYRMVMVLRELESLTCKEIATIVSSTHSTVRWRLHVARKMFRRQWEIETRRSQRGIEQ